MLNATNKNIALAIGAAYCGSNIVCKESLFNRLNTFFYDATFQNFLRDLTSRRYAVAQFSLPMQYSQLTQTYKSIFSVMDLVNGESASYPITLPSFIYNPNNTDWKKCLEAVNYPHLRFEKVVGSHILFSSAQHGGYEISYTTNPTSGGGSGSGNGGGSVVPGVDDGGHNTGGSIIVNTPGGGSVGGSPGVVPVEKVFSVFDDLQPLIIPGVVLFAVYMLMKK